MKIIFKFQFLDSFFQSLILGRSYHSSLYLSMIVRGFVSRPPITIPRPSKSSIRYLAMLLLTVRRRESEVALERKRRRKSRAAKRKIISENERKYRILQHTGKCHVLSFLTFDSIFPNVACRKNNNDFVSHKLWVKKKQEYRISIELR